MSIWLIFEIIEILINDYIQLEIVIPIQQMTLFEFWYSLAGGSVVNQTSLWQFKNAQYTFLDTKGQKNIKDDVV